MFPIVPIILVGVQMVLVLTMVFSTWVLVCNARTHRDIVTFLECVRHRPVTAPSLLAAFQKVTYRQHMRALVWWRDPWKLYDPAILEAMKNPRTEHLVGGAMFVAEKDGAFHVTDRETQH